MKVDCLSKIDFRLFGKNAIIYAIGNICARFAAFLLIPLYTHSLSLNEYGLLATLLITIQVMTTVISMGTHKGFMRFANECEEKNLIRKLIGTTTAIIIVSASAITGMSLLFLSSFFHSLLHTTEVHNYVILICLTSIFQTLYNNVTSYYRAKNEGLMFFIANFAVLILLIITNYLLLRVYEQGVKGVLMAQIMTYGSLWLLLLMGLISKTGLGFSLELGKRLLWFSFPLLFGMLWVQVMEISAVYFLGYFRSFEQVAIYSLGHKIAQIAGIILILPFQLAYEPFIYGNLDNPKIKIVISRLLTYLMFGYTFLAFCIVFMARPLLSLIAPPAYFSAYTVVFLLLPGMAFIGVYYVGESILGIMNKTSLIGGLVTISAIGSLALNYLLIPIWGMYGAIFVFNVTQMFTALILMRAGMKMFSIQLERKRLVMIGTLFLSLLLFVFVLRGMNDYIYYSVIPAVACTILCFLYFGGYFDDREKAFIKSLLQGARSIVYGRKLMAD